MIFLFSSSVSPSVYLSSFFELDQNDLETIWLLLQFYWILRDWPSDHSWNLVATSHQASVFQFSSHVPWQLVGTSAGRITVTSSGPRASAKWNSSSIPPCPFLNHFIVSHHILLIFGPFVTFLLSVNMLSHATLAVIYKWIACLAYDSAIWMQCLVWHDFKGVNASAWLLCCGCLVGCRVVEW